MIESRVSFPIVPSAPVFKHDQGSLLDRLIRFTHDVPSICPFGYCPAASVTPVV